MASSLNPQPDNGEELEAEDHVLGGAQIDALHAIAGPLGHVWSQVIVGQHLYDAILLVGPSVLTGDKQYLLVMLAFISIDGERGWSALLFALRASAATGRWKRRRPCHGGSKGRGRGQ